MIIPNADISSQFDQKANPNGHPKNTGAAEENLMPVGALLQNTSIPLWEFYELHKEKSIVQLLSSEYMCLDDIHSVKTIVWL